MMSREKQIEEMAEEISDVWNNKCQFTTCKGCKYNDFNENKCQEKLIADHLITKGYRKQSEGYWFFTEYEYFTCSNCGKSHFNFCDSSAEARKRLAEGEYYPYCPECGAKMKGGAE